MQSLIFYNAYRSDRVGAEIRRRECENIFVVLQKTGWKIKGTDGVAQLLGVKPTTLVFAHKKGWVWSVPSKGPLRTAHIGSRPR